MEKGQEANWLSLFTEPFSPAGRVWFKHHILRLYLRLQRWMRDVMFFWKSFEISLRDVRVGTSIETLWILIRWSAYLNKEFLGSVCVSLADYHIWTPHSFKQSRSQTCGRGWWWWWRGHQYSAAWYGKHYSKIKYQSEWKILAPVLTSITCNHIKSCKHARSVAWTGPDHRPQHQYVSSSLHFASDLLLSSLFYTKYKKI